MQSTLLTPGRRACPFGAADLCAELGHCVVPDLPSHATGVVRPHRVIESDYLQLGPKFEVYLPPGYACEERPYPAFYLLDGQNLFDHASPHYWNFKEILDRQISSGHIEPVIVTGVHAARRVPDYTHVAMHGHGGEGAKHDACLVREIKTFVDERFRTMRDRNQTGIGGFSLGGLSALHTALIEQPGVFSAVIALSPTLRWGGGAILKAIEKIQKSDTRIFIGMGEHEVNLPQAYELFELLKRKGWVNGADLLFFMHEGQEHGTPAWRALIRDQVLMSFLGFARS